MSEGGSRRAVAEIRFGEDRSSITKVAGRSIHQFWSLLSPHFRDVLLAPQRRSDDGGVAWTWREGMEKKPLTAAELAGVRKRLERANESFAENPVNPLMGDDRSGTSSQALIDQVAAKVKAMADSLAAKSDAALSDFVCRTETGIMIHSWGVASPAPVIYPESMETGLSGVVLAGSKRLEGYEVVVENTQGLSVARTRSESSGEFHFTKIPPGRYRVRVVSGRVKFPAKGVMATVERGAVARLEMRSAADLTADGEAKENESGGASADEAASSTGSTPPHQRSGGGWFGKATGVVVLLLLFGSGGVWAWRTWWRTDDEANRRAAVQSSSMAPENFSAGASQTRAANSAGSTTGEGAGLGASADGVAGSAQRPVSSPVVSADRSVNVVVGGRGQPPSTIGSRVDVQSGVAEAPSVNAPSPGDSPGISEGMNNAGEEPEAAPVDVASGSGDAKAQEASVRKTNAVPGAGSAFSNAGVKGGNNVVAALESGSLDDSKRSPGGTEPEGAVTFTNKKKKGKVQALGALPTRTPSATNGEPPSGGAISGNPATDPSSEAVTVNLPQSEKAQATGPISKVLVVNKKPVAGKTPSRNEIQTGETGNEGEEKPDFAPKPTTETPGPKKPGSDGKKSVAGNAVAKTPSAKADAQDEAALVPAPLAETNQPLEVLNISTGKEDGTPPAEPVNGTSVPASAAVKAAVAGGAKDALAAARSPVARSGVVAANKEKSSSAEAGATEPEQDVNSTMPGGSDGKMASYEIAAVRWEVRLVRDAIVPTVPVRVGETDSASLVRKKLISERKGLVPEMFKNSAPRVGFVFMLPELPGGGAFYWRDVKDAVKKTSDGNQAQISWAGNALPLGSVSILVFPNGQEAVRLTIKENGSLLLRLAEGVRGSLRLGVPRVVADESGPASEKRVSRFGWQVNGVARRIEELKSEERDYGIDFPLEKAKATRLDVALADRVTGWALATQLQLRPGKPGGAGVKEIKDLVR